MVFSFGVLASEVLYYPKPEADFDERTGYPLQLLRMAMDEVPELAVYELRPTQMKMPRGRALRLLQKQVGVDVFWSINSSERESILTPVRFDIFQGMFGYRLFLIRSESLAGFERLSSNSELQQKVALAGHDWPDYQILKNNGFEVQGASSYTGLFRLLQKGRADYFPRSIFEIGSELEHFEDENIVIEPNYGFFYPVEFYFFVAKQRKDLAVKLLEGLIRLEQKGESKVLFDTVYGSLSEHYRLKQRHIIQLKVE